MKQIRMCAAVALGFLAFTASSIKLHAVGDSFIYERGPTTLESTLPPSPEPWSAVRYTDVPFTHSLGLAELDIPVYTIKGRELSIPLSLSYRSGGIKLEEVAGVAGLGWTLNAGGCVTRTVVDMPDEFTTADFSHSMPSGTLLSDLQNGVNNTQTMNYLRSNLWHGVDSSLDRYNYSVNGLSGSFVILDDGTVFQLCGDGSVIEPEYDSSGAIDSFTITGPDGTVYILSQKETGTHMGRFQNQTPTTGQPDEWEATTAWYLTGMVSASGLDTAEFSYIEDVTWDRSIPCTVDNATITREGYYQTVSTAVTFDYLVYRYNTHFLSSITLDGFTVSFDYSSDTGYGAHITGGGTDNQNCPRRLTGISVRYDSTTLMQLEVGTARQERDGRIILSSLRFKSSGILRDQWDFTYKTPPRAVSRFSQDWYGYYNAENEALGSSGNRIRTCPFSMNGSTGALTLQWGQPNAAEASLMSLVRADHDGAVTEYEYEGATIVSGGVTYSVGIRVKSISVKEDLLTVRRKRNFTYFSPVASGPYVPTQNMYVHVSAKESQTSTGLVPTMSYTWSFSLHGSPVTGGRSIQQTQLSFGTVNEELTDGGASQHGPLTSFTYDTSGVPGWWQGTIGRFPSGWAAGLYSSATYAPQNPDPWWGVRDGYFEDSPQRPALLADKSTYAWNGTSHVLKESESYYYDTPSYRTVLVEYAAVQVCERYLTGDLRYEDIYHYPVWATDYAGQLPTYVTRTTYHDDGSSDTDALEYTYLDRGDLSLPPRMSTATAAGSDRTRRISYTYPDTWTGGTPGWAYALVSRHSLSKPVKTAYESIVPQSSTPSEWTELSVEYDTFTLPGGGTALLPSLRTETVDGVTAWNEEILTCDRFGNPSSLKATGHPVTSVVWSYNGLYPVVVAENAAWTSIVSAFGSATAVNAFTAAEDLTAYNYFLIGLASSLPASLVSIFKYSPGKGVSETVKPSGVSAEYYYDWMGRLVEVCNDGGQTVESISYNLLNSGGLRNITHSVYHANAMGLATTDVHWYDVLGMALEDVAVGASGSGDDLVTAFEGDYLHDDVKTWLPYPVGYNYGGYVSGAAQAAAAWHGTAQAYTKKAYEQSTRDRLLKTAAPGYAGVHEGTYSTASVSGFPKLSWNNGSVQSLGYYPSGMIIRTGFTDADGRPSSEYRDHRGRLLGTSTGYDAPTYYVYDGHDRLCAVVGSGISIVYGQTANMWRYTYDSHGRLSSKGIPGSAAEAYTYDAEDHIIRITRADGYIDKEYDVFGREVKVWYTRSGGSAVQVEEYAWDAEPSAAISLMTGAGESYSWNGPKKGLQTYARFAVLGPDGTVTGYAQKAYRYDSEGRPKCVVTGYPDGDILKEEYTYTPLGEVTSSVTSYKHGTVTDKLTQGWTYDSRGRITAVESNLYTGTTLQDHTVTSYTYDDLGRLSAETSGGSPGSVGSLVTTTAYTLQGLLSERKSSYGSSIIYDEDLVYDSTPVATGIPASYTGLITGKHEDILGQGLNHINRSTGYEYDSSGRLASALVPDKILSTYYHDARGNLTYSSVQDLQTYATDVTEYTYSGDLIYSATHNDTTCYFSHNSLGGVTYDGLSKRVIQYSYIGFPAKILDENNTVLAEYCYLADGTKLSAERADGTGFVYRGSLKYTLGSGGAITLLGAEIPAGLLTPGGSRYRVTDHLGSVVYELNAAGGTLADGGLYDAWGVRSGIAGSAASPTSLHHFTGQEDQAPGLGVPYTDFGARNYSPALGRWLAPDPLSEKYYGISPYAYCAGDPVNLVDPDGTSWYFNNKNGDFYYHVEDDDDHIYMISLEQFNAASNSDDMASSLRSFRSDDNLLGNIYGNSDSKDIVTSVISFFYDYANRTCEKGTVPIYRPGLTSIVWHPESQDGSYYSIPRNENGVLNVYGNNSVWFGYEIMTLLAHEIGHQLDKESGLLFSLDRTTRELRADSFAQNHWAYNKSKEGQKKIQQHITELLMNHNKQL